MMPTMLVTLCFMWESELITFDDDAVVDMATTLTPYHCIDDGDKRVAVGDRDHCIGGETCFVAYHANVGIRIVF